MEEISEQELNERVAILRRFRTLLEEQRKKFQDYLAVLEKQENSIEKEDIESLTIHAELEQNIVHGITNLQKVIVPIAEMYKSTSKANSESETQSVDSIKKELSKLQDKVLAQNEKNRKLLKQHLVQVKTQLDQFKNPYNNVSSVYAKKVAQGNFITVEV